MFSSRIFQFLKLPLNAFNYTVAISIKISKRYHTMQGNMLSYQRVWMEDIANVCRWSRTMIGNIWNIHSMYLFFRKLQYSRIADIHVLFTTLPCQVLTVALFKWSVDLGGRFVSWDILWYDLDRPDPEQRLLKKWPDKFETCVKSRYLHHSY